MAGAGGAWKVAYADFVTAMMAFFLVMWIVAQNKPAVKEAIAVYFNDPLGISSKPGRSRLSVPSAGKVDNDPNDKGNKGKNGSGQGSIDLQSEGEDNPEGGTAKKASQLMMHDGNKAQTGTMIPFPDDTADIDAKGKEKLDQLLPELVGKPFKIELRGHTSTRVVPKKGAFKDAWDLSYARAVAVREYLVRNGVEPKRFRLSAASAYEPKSLGQDAVVRGLNSRVEIFVLNELVEDVLKKDKDPKRSLKPEAKPKEESGE